MGCQTRGLCPSLVWLLIMEIATKLTDEHLRRANELLEKGYPEYVVSRLLGIPYSSWKYWKRAAKQLRDILEDDLQSLRDEGIIKTDGSFDEDDKNYIQSKLELEPDQVKILTHLTNCEKGKAYCIAEHIDNLKKQSNDHWQASAWWLERADRENFGKQETVINKGTIANVNIPLTPEEEEQYKKNLSSIYGGLYGNEG